MTWVKWMSTTNELELKQFLINLDIIVKNHVILIINDITAKKCPLLCSKVLPIQIQKSQHLHDIAACKTHQNFFGLPIRNGEQGMLVLSCQTYRVFCVSQVPVISTVDY